MISTAAIVESFRQLPEKISLDEAVERLIILDRYGRAMEEIGQEKGHKNEDVMREMKEWIQASR
ncbi:hypothetical protein [Spirosoma validum]|uniref:Antitoxin n=1 Tax=Spirosoma validum TaxID=2771355 RepID=A0A927GCZ5_9BACT|nr:hypothetical protein [Spirosoma validum]MBD2753174.1 hypothetical protein [Spirosoma validum]